MNHCWFIIKGVPWHHYCDVIMSTSLTIVYSTVYSGADQTQRQSSASLAFVRGIHRWPMNTLHKGQVKRKKFPFDDVIMIRHTAISQKVRRNLLRQVFGDYTLKMSSMCTGNQWVKVMPAVHPIKWAHVVVLCYFVKVIRNNMWIIYDPFTYVTPSTGPKVPASSINI